MAHRNNSKVLINGPDYLWVLGIILAVFAALIFSNMPSFAQGSGYYEIPNSGRPRSVFSLCCCKRITETTENITYSCQYSELKTCPVETESYNTTFTDCPSNLIYTKYSKDNS